MRIKRLLLLTPSETGDEGIYRAVTITDYEGQLVYVYEDITYVRIRGAAMDGAAIFRKATRDELDRMKAAE